MELLKSDLYSLVVILLVKVAQSLTAGVFHVANNGMCIQ